MQVDDRNGRNRWEQKTQASLNLYLLYLLLLHLYAHTWREKAWQYSAANPQRVFSECTKSPGVVGTVGTVGTAVEKPGIFLFSLFLPLLPVREQTTATATHELQEGM